ncbi:MAG: hypothetical protein ABR563_08310 [Pyrinomonadaceae bacterium]
MNPPRLCAVAGATFDADETDFAPPRADFSCALAPRCHDDTPASANAHASAATTNLTP